MEYKKNKIWNERNAIHVLDLLRDVLSIRKASKICNIPRSTLFNWKKSGIQSVKDFGHAGRPRNFSDSEEVDLVIWIKEMARNHLKDF